MTTTAPPVHRVGFLGAPNTWRHDFTAPVEWNGANVARLKSLGFNTVQINVAWGSRPGDEPLSLEDVVALAPGQEERFPQPVPLKCDPSPEARARRRQTMRDRIELCRKAGLRTIFHFGAPYNAHGRYGDAPPNCISDEKVARRYALLLEVFAREFPGVDDILIYTYDQDAWLCSEFGSCTSCRGVPLHQRLVPFLERLAAAWQALSPRGRLWWEPWELSAGQALQCVERVSAKGMGLALHSNIAEVQATFVADRWLRNTCEQASRRGIPVIVEYFLGAASEELEPYVHLSHPLVTLRALQTLFAVSGVTGIKEYYGLVPNKEDPNLRMTGLFFSNPRISEDEALALLAKPYAEASAEMASFWRETSAGMELFPWDCCWSMRHVGTRTPIHGLSAAALNGYVAHTPGWASTRQAIYMRTDNTRPDPWVLEDVQLRCELAAGRWERALEIGRNALAKAPGDLAGDLRTNLTELAGLKRRALSYAFHLRETNLAAILRGQKEQGQPPPPIALRELQEVMEKDLRNCREEDLAWEEMRQAVELLKQDVDRFLQTYFRDGVPG